MNIIFKNEEHKTMYKLFLDRYGLAQHGKTADSYHRALFYTLAISDTLARNINSLYNFEDAVIKHEGLNNGFQTGSSIKLTRLAFNLFNGFNGETYNDIKGEYERIDDAKWYTPYELFCNIENQPYMLEAVKLRYPD